MGIAAFWHFIGDIGKEHCRTPHEIRTTRISNLTSASGAFLIFMFFLFSCLQFHFQYAGYLLFQVSLILILFLTLYFNHLGYLLVAKITGLLCSMVYVVGLNMIAGNQMGGAYMLLVTALLPMILFEKRWLYTLFFILHIFAFFFNYNYQLHHTAIIRMSPEEIPVSYCSAVLVMFAALYLIMQHFLKTNQDFEYELTQSKKIIEDKNRNMLDSIEYARRIQGNILPPPASLQEIVPDSFILFQPKDIVSGDFYWFHEVSGNDSEAGSSFLIAACDCTGHGVPGALVSVVCSTALDKAAGEFGLIEPASILNKVNELVARELGKKSGSDQDMPDGMDVSLCRLDLNRMRLAWAGAQNPLWLLRDGEILEFKADKKSVGNFHGDFSFSQHETALKPGDALFMFSDGFADQFGGSSGKKLSRLGFRNLLIAAADKPMPAMKEHLTTMHAAWQGAFPQVDDICVIGIRM